MDDTTLEVDELESEELDPRDIIDNARNTFRLSDRLKGIKHRSEKVVLFMDVEAVDAYQKLNEKAQAIANAAGAVDLKTESGPERHAILLAAYNELEPQVETAKVKMLSSAVTVYLHAWPNIAAKVARKNARKKFHDEVLGAVPQDKLSDAAEFVDMQLLGASIIKIVDAEGNVDTLEPYTEGKGSKKKLVKPRETIGMQLSDDLPPSQWARLYDTYQKLTLTDQIEQAATDDPGF
jgi:hypothetical protein